LNAQEKAELWDLAEFAQKLLRRVVKAHGFNIGVNIGEAAGAGCADHLHLHIVPRWSGDHNFITVLGNARVIPDGLRPMYDKLVEAKAGLAAD
jgi:ATP adenylyltransferase